MPRPTAYPLTFFFITLSGSPGVGETEETNQNSVSATRTRTEPCSKHQSLCLSSCLSTISYYLQQVVLGALLGESTPLRQHRLQTLIKAIANTLSCFVGYWDFEFRDDTRSREHLMSSNSRHHSSKMQASTTKPCHTHSQLWLSSLALSYAGFLV